MKLDHIMYAARDLDEGIAHVRSLTGDAPAYGGSHPGGGTRNALLSLGADQYLEIIAPDPAQDAAGTMAEELLSIDVPRVRTWAAATRDFGRVSDMATAAGFGHHVVDMSRTRPDGVHLAWRLLFVTGHPFGLALPFFIDWLASPHPAADSPGASNLAGFTVTLPDAAGYARFCEAIDLDVQVTAGEPALSAVIEAPAGTVTL